MRHVIAAYLVHFKLMIYEVSFKFGYYLRRQQPMQTAHYHKSTAVPFFQSIHKDLFQFSGRAMEYSFPKFSYQWSLYILFRQPNWWFGGTSTTKDINVPGSDFQTILFSYFIITLCPFLIDLTHFNIYCVLCVSLQKRFIICRIKGTLVTKRTQVSVKFHLYWICSPPTDKLILIISLEMRLENHNRVFIGTAENGIYFLSFSRYV